MYQGEVVNKLCISGQSVSNHVRCGADVAVAVASEGVRSAVLIRGQVARGEILGAVGPVMDFRSQAITRTA